MKEKTENADKIGRYFIPDQSTTVLLTPAVGITPVVSNTAYVYSQFTTSFKLKCSYKKLLKMIKVFDKSGYDTTWLGMEFDYFVTIKEKRSDISYTITVTPPVTTLKDGITYDKNSYL